MNCKYLKQKLNRKLYCKKLKSDIKISSCSNCIYKEYKHIPDVRKSNDFGVNNKIVKKSKKLAKLERNRSSILTDDLDHCYLCGRPKEHLHELFFGVNRIKSIKYKLVIPVCFECHNKIHNDIRLQNYTHKLGQKKFNEVYPDLDFVKIFKRNYLD